MVRILFAALVVGVTALVLALALASVPVKIVIDPTSPLHNLSISEIEDAYSVSHKTTTRGDVDVWRTRWGYYLAHRIKAFLRNQTAIFVRVQEPPTIHFRSKLTSAQTQQTEDAAARKPAASSVRWHADVVVDGTDGSLRAFLEKDQLSRGRIRVVMPDGIIFEARRTELRDHRGGFLLWFGTLTKHEGTLIMLASETDALQITIYTPQGTYFADLDSSNARGVDMSDYIVTLTRSLPEESQTHEPKSRELSSNKRSSVGQFGETCREDEHGPPSPADETSHRAIKVRAMTTQYASSLGIDLNSRLINAEFFLNVALRNSGARSRVSISLADTLIPNSSTPEEEKTRVIDALIDVARRARVSEPTSELTKNLKETEIYARVEERLSPTDELALIITGSRPPDGSCGWASSIPATTTSYFAIVAGDDNCLIRDQSVAHEIGHLVGGHHELEDEGQTMPPTSHGYIRVTPDGEEGDIMSTARRRLMRFSSGKRARKCNDALLGNKAFADSVDAFNSYSGRYPDQNATAEDEYPSCGDTQLIVPIEGGSACRENGYDSAFYHEPNKSELLELERVRLEDYAKTVLAPRLQRSQGRQKGQKPAIIVAGHTDSKGSDASNLGLSLQRAEDVVPRLRGVLATLGLYPSIRPCAYGKRRLACREEGTEIDVEKAKAANRRIEVFVQ